MSRVDSGAKTLIYGKKENDNTDEVALKSKYNGKLQIDNKQTPFGELSVVNRTTLIELKSIYDISDLRDVVTTTSGGTVTNTASSYKLATNSGGSDKAIFDSGEIGRYVPGLTGEAGLGVRIPTAPTGNQDIKVGYFDDNDGIFWGYDANGLYVGYRNSGTDTTIRQSNFEIDTLDGNGPSGLNLDVSDGHIFQVLYTWYGHGDLVWQLSTSDDNIRQQTIEAHRERITGRTSISNPNLPIRAEVSNNGTTQPLEIYVSGRQYSLLGKYEPNLRKTAQDRLSQTVGSGFTPLITFKKKTDRINTSVKMDAFQMFTDHNLEVQVRLNPTLTGASFVAPNDIPAKETATEVDISATGVSGGIAIDKSFAGTAKQNQTSLAGDNPLNLDFINEQNVTLVARSIDGTDANVSTMVKVREEW